MRSLWLTVALTASLMVPAYSRDLSIEDMTRMNEIYTQNSIRFERDYIGRAFSARIPFKNVSRSVGLQGHIHLQFGELEKSSEDVTCLVPDKNRLDEIASWNKGDLIDVSGAVSSHLGGGGISLDKCSFGKQ